MIASLGIKQSFAAGPLPIAAAAADVNGDGKPDLIAADDNGSRVLVLRNTTAHGAASASVAALQS